MKMSLIYKNESVGGTHFHMNGFDTVAKGDSKIAYSSTLFQPMPNNGIKNQK